VSEKKSKTKSDDGHTSIVTTKAFLTKMRATSPRLEARKERRDQIRSMSPLNVTLGLEAVTTVTTI